MPSRPDVIADAAVSVLSRDGLRGLTHRAVDAEAGLPAGSTSNCFRSRTALVEAVVSRLENLDATMLSAGRRPDPTSLSAAAASLARSVEAMTSPDHVRVTRARLSLLLDETARPRLEAGHLRFLEMLVTALEDAGHPEPRAAARAVADLLEGALVHAASVSARVVDVDELAGSVERLLR